MKLNDEEIMVLARSLYWYWDKLTNTGEATEWQNNEWDVVALLRQKVEYEIKKKAMLP